MKAITTVVFLVLLLSGCGNTAAKPSAADVTTAPIPIKTEIIGLGIIEEQANMDFISLFGIVSSGMQFSYDGGDVAAKAKNSGIPDDEKIKAVMEKSTTKLPSGLILLHYTFDGQVIVPNRPYQISEGKAVIEGRKANYLPVLVTDALGKLYGDKTGVNGILFIDGLTTTAEGENLVVRAKVLVFEEK